MAWNIFVWKSIVLLLRVAPTIISSKVEYDVYDFEPFESSSESSETNISSDALNQVRFFQNSTNPWSENSQEIKIGRYHTLKTSHFNKSNQFKILIHGFMGECAYENFPNRIIQAYREQNDEFRDNLICVDWGPLSNQGGQLSILLYRRAVDNSVFVGKRIAEFIKYLMDKRIILSVKDIHLIGFSLGAHVAGTTGHFIEKYYNEKIGRITGLDPAGPFFDEEKKVDHKLDKSDADFVDIYHTSGGKLGIGRSIGHVDFYPNGGRKQPQCQQTGDAAVDFEEAVAGSCSHYMVPKYFAESIAGRQRKACKCSNWREFKKNDCECKEIAILGEHCSTSARGNYYLTIEDDFDGNSTTEQSPFYN